MAIKPASARAKRINRDREQSEFSDLRISDDELIGFTESLRDLFEAGLPVNQILNQLKTSARNEKFSEAIAKMLLDVENGLLLSQAMERFNVIFGEDYRSLIRAAEKSGRWTKSRRADKSDGILEMLLKYLNRKGRTIEKVKSGLLYPAMITVAIIGALTAFVFYVIPALKQLFSAIHAADSFFIRMLFAFADFAENYWITVPIGAALGGYALWHYYRYGGGRAVWMKYQLRLKLVGDVFATMHLAESSFLLGTLFAAGLTPQEVLKSAAECSRNDEIGTALRRAREMMLSEGVSFSESLKRSHWIFEKGQTYMVLSSAQKNGNLGSALESYAERLMEKLDHKLDRLVRSIEPAMICIAGVAVGLIAITFYGSLSAAIANLAAH